MSIPYEFTAEDNVIIHKAGTRAKTWGVMSIVLGTLPAALAVMMILEGVSGVFSAIYLLVTLLPIYLGVSFLRAGSELREVVNTAGKDVPHLLAALNNLSKAFAIQIGMTVFFLVFMLTSVVIAFLQYGAP